jgi:TonB-linked SusC/RagA family outer membrane protein
MYAEADLFKGLTLRTSFGGDITNSNDHAFTYPTYENVENSQTNSYNENSANSYSYNWTNTLTYLKTFGKHNLNVVIGTEAVETYDKSLGGSIQGFYNFDPDYVSLSTGTTNKNTYSSKSSTSLLSEFARLDYVFDNKYLFNATIRRDGSSKFPVTQRYGYFPAFSAGWRVSQEGFLKEVKWLTDLKVRGGWGIMGNQINMGAKDAYTTFGTNIGQSYYPLDGNSALLPGFYQDQIANPNALWEKDINSNFGFDATLLNGKVAITADYYRKDIKDLLYAARQLGTAGNGNVPAQNVGKMKTDGLDISVTSNITVNKDLSFNATGTLTTYNNKILKVSDDRDYFVGDATSRFDSPITRSAVGHSLGEFYGYQIAGFWNNQAQIDAADASAQKITNDPNAVYQSDTKVGRFRYKDVNGDGVITDADRTFIGNPNPKFTTGLNLAVNYKNFDASVFFYGSFGNKLWNSVKYWRDFYASFGTAKSYTALNDSWTPTHQNAKAPIQELDASTSSGATPNSYFVENGTYVRMRNAQIGYTFKVAGLKKAGIQKLRVYVSATNLFTLTGYSGVDPELSGNTKDFGIDEGSYASPRTFLFGVNFSL